MDSQPDQEQTVLSNGCTESLPNSEMQKLEVCNKEEGKAPHQLDIQLNKTDPTQKPADKSKDPSNTIFIKKENEISENQVSSPHVINGGIPQMDNPSKDLNKSSQSSKTDQQRKSSLGNQHKTQQNLSVNLNAQQFGQSNDRINQYVNIVLDKIIQIAQEGIRQFNYSGNITSLNMLVQRVPQGQLIRQKINTHFTLNRHTIQKEIFRICLSHIRKQCAEYNSLSQMKVIIIKLNEKIFAQVIVKISQIYSLIIVQLQHSDIKFGSSSDNSKQSLQELISQIPSNSFGSGKTASWSQQLNQRNPMQLLQSLSLTRISQNEISISRDNQSQQPVVLEADILSYLQQQTLTFLNAIKFEKTWKFTIQQWKQHVLKILYDPR